MTREKTPSPLSEFLAASRRERGLSLRELAFISDVPHSVISHIETGYIQEPSFRVICQLAYVLHLDMTDLEHAALQPSP
jgi:transcriptional regulator with XRE-family HTH domain